MAGMGIFSSVIIILGIFNIGYCFIYPNEVMIIGIGAITGFAVTVLAIGILSGITIFSSGLSTTSQTVLFVTVALLNILFQFTVPVDDYTIPIGLGLLQNVYEVFLIYDFWGIGFIICTILGLLALVSGLMMASGSGAGEG